MISPALKILMDRGINIFGAVHVADLPADLRDKFQISFTGPQSLILFGSGGPTLWSHIPHPAVEAENPVDTFAADAIDEFLKMVLPGQKIKLLYPNSQYQPPLQRLSRHLNLSHPSLLGIDLHREFGPWFAFRRLVLIDGPAPEFPASDPWPSPCPPCEAKPCLTACPVQAVTSTIFDLKKCAGHRLAPESDCLPRCASRLACPQGASQKYTDDQIRYHMLRPSHLKMLSKFA
jgi:hypothetical protein